MRKLSFKKKVPLFSFFLSFILNILKIENYKKKIFFTEHFILLKTIDSNYTVNVAAAQADPAAVTHISVPWSNVELMAIL